ncbi:hypothetical protein [Plantactinospora sonchi]|uniref:Uncharacterized protein n=1 Tax=Plantactinospora sonchi TaxID=1544735 RepID=A0ABU7RLU1_9ACTN
MDGSVTSEDEALGLWCENLPALRAEAARAGAAGRLDRDVARVRSGGSVLSAYRKWLATADPATWRTWSEPGGVAMAGLPGPSPVGPVGTGSYRCPVGRCGRTAGRDPQGHPPDCAAFDAPMTPDRR